MQALYISIYSEYTEQQRNGIKRFSTHENSHVGDVFMVKTFATIQWWTQADFYKEIVNISGNRLKELFPVKIMTQINLPCELRCLELNYALETDENTIYAIPAEQLTTINLESRPQPIITTIVNINQEGHYKSDIKLKWKLIYDDPADLLIPQISTENNFVKDMKKIAENKKEDQTTKVARILTTFVNFAKELENSKKYEKEKLNKPLLYTLKEPLGGQWNEENPITLEFNNTQERNHLFRSRKSRKARRKIQQPGELDRPTTPFPDPTLEILDLSLQPNPIPFKRPYTPNDLNRTQPERPPNPLIQSYDITQPLNVMIDDDVMDNNNVMTATNDLVMTGSTTMIDDDARYDEEEDDTELLNKEQLDMIQLEDRAWKRVESSLNRRNKLRFRSRPPQTVTRVIRQHNCPYDDAAATTTTKSYLDDEELMNILTS